MSRVNSKQNSEEEKPQNEQVYDKLNANAIVLREMKVAESALVFEIKDSKQVDAFLDEDYVKNTLVGTLEQHQTTRRLQFEKKEEIRLSSEGAVLYRTLTVRRSTTGNNDPSYRDRVMYSLLSVVLTDVIVEQDQHKVMLEYVSIDLLTEDVISLIRYDRETMRLIFNVLQPEKLDELLQQDIMKFYMYDHFFNGFLKITFSKTDSGNLVIKRHFSQHDLDELKQLPNEEGLARLNQIKYEFIQGLLRYVIPDNIENFPMRSDIAGEYPELATAHPEFDRQTRRRFFDAAFYAGATVCKVKYSGSVSDAEQITNSGITQAMNRVGIHANQSASAATGTVSSGASGNESKSASEPGRNELGGNEAADESGSSFSPSAGT